MIFRRLGKDDEASLIKRCRQNNAAAQEHLYKLYAEDMMILCLRYIANEEDAKEVLMDGFCSFFRNIESFAWRGEGSVKAWLKKIIVNQCLMFLRKKNHMVLVGDTVVFEDRIADTDILSGLTAKEIMKALHSLPDVWRTVINLYVFEEMQHKEIAALMGITENTSKSHLHRARLQLKKQLLPIT